MIHEIKGNLFDSDAKYIVHQCNCASTRAAHLAKSVFEQFPYADEYSGRTVKSIPGTISIKGNGVDQRFVIAIFGQYFPGAPKYTSGVDTELKRRNYFYNGLKEILKIEDLVSIAFPDHIGCGAAAGDWDFYRKLIGKFAEATPQTDVYIYNFNKE